ncbi:mitochondrial ribosomal protein S25 [Glomus cerebriforme]|uniref:Small ribosomal subunit protein mS23 n=1 Tax=Glomus cerebriforme TaxID=658196 RepID=A0A397SQW6_9GLOM|nr:mitochondrial ribosomal protein S25 [Glomus cerebriforme]
MYRATPKQFHNHVSKLLTGEIIKTLPAWYSAMKNVPPGQNLLRSPLQFREDNLQKHNLRLRSNVKSHSQKHLRTKIPRPQKIYYMLDGLRRDFYRDHPYELLRPQILMEHDDGSMNKDLLCDLKFPCRVTGEDVIRYQEYLIKKKGINKYEAYVEACNEFYKIRAREEVAERVAEEQALLFGARGGQSQTERALWLEHKNLQKSEPQVITQVLKIIS